MPYESIIVERRERVGMITLNRPQQFNMFNIALADELCKALTELERKGWTPF
jgi:enoyl-CoA hydratase